MNNIEKSQSRQKENSSHELDECKCSIFLLSTGKIHHPLDYYNLGWWRTHSDRIHYQYHSVGTEQACRCVWWSSVNMHVNVASSRDFLLVSNIALITFIDDGMHMLDRLLRGRSHGGPVNITQVSLNFVSVKSWGITNVMLREEVEGSSSNTSEMKKNSLTYTKKNFTCSTQQGQAQIRNST